MASNRCSMCRESGGICICRGCQQFFCVKDFTNHRQQLSMQFDHDVVESHDELLEQMKQANQPNRSSANLFSQIDLWETTTINKVYNAAERARHKLLQLINSERETLTEQFDTLSKEIRRRRKEEDFAEDEVKQLREQINRLQQSLEQLIRSDRRDVTVAENEQIDWNQIIDVLETKKPNWSQKDETRRKKFVAQSKSIDRVKESSQMIDTASTRHVDITPNARWAQNGTTVAGGHEKGDGLNQLSLPYGICVDDDQTVYIAEYSNHRVVEWKCGATTGQVVAGGNGEGTRNDQLRCPTDVIVDKQTDSLLICDYVNNRVVRWLRRGGTYGQTVISGVLCWGLTMDNDRFLYVSDWDNHEVRRWRMGETQGTLVAGGNGKGQRLDQLSYPTYVFVDRDQSVFVSDKDNDRVMKWVKGAKEGIVVAGGQGKGNALTQLSSPQGVFVDQWGTVFVADGHNHRIMHWPKGAKQGSIVVGGNGPGRQASQLNGIMGLSLDVSGNFYAVDCRNSRVQKFLIERRSS